MKALVITSRSLFHRAPFQRASWLSLDASRCADLGWSACRAARPAGLRGRARAAAVRWTGLRSTRGQTRAASRWLHARTGDHHRQRRTPIAMPRGRGRRVRRRNRPGGRQKWERSPPSAPRRLSRRPPPRGRRKRPSLQPGRGQQAPQRTPAHGIGVRDVVQTGRCGR